MRYFLQRLKSHRGWQGLMAVGFGLLLTLGGIWLAERNKTITAQAQVRLAGQVLAVELADTPVAQARGLGGRCQLADSQGMLFRYNEPTMPNYWMKRMRFPIDLIWIRDGVVVGYEQSMAVDGGKRHYPAPEPVDQVLEVRPGWVEEHGVSRGDRVEFLGLL